MGKRKIRAGILVFGLSAAMLLAGCGSTDQSGAAASTATTAASETTAGKASANVMINSNAASTEKVTKAESEISSEDGTQITGEGTGQNYEARVGDTCNTHFFSYNINGTNIADSFEGYTPKSGNQLLIVGVSIENTWRKTITMYDTDFQAQWDDEDDPANAYAYPIAYQNVAEMQQLPAKYTLGVGESLWGTLIYEVPKGYTDFSIAYQEQFADGSTGDSFFTYFTSTKLEETTTESTESATEETVEAVTEESADAESTGETAASTETITEITDSAASAE